MDGESGDDEGGDIWWDRESERVRNGYIRHIKMI